MKLVKSNLGIVGSWPLDEGGGAIAYDRSGNGNNGTLVNAPTSVIEKNGRALSFNGTSQYVSVATLPFGYSATAYKRTISFWAKGSGVALHNIRDTTNVGDASIGIDASCYLGYTLESNSSPPYAYGVTSPITANSSVLNHYVIVLDMPAMSPSTNYSATVVLYTNGIGSTQTLNFYVSVGNISFTALNIARCYNYVYSSSYFSGSISNVRIYNRALSAREVMDLYINPNNIYVKRPSLLSMIAGLIPNFTAIYGAAYMSQQQSGLISTSTNVAAALAAVQSSSGLINVSNSLAAQQNTSSSTAATIASSASIACALSIGFNSSAQGLVAQNILGAGNTTQSATGSVLSSVAIAAASNMSVLSFGNITVTAPVGGYIAGSANYSAGAAGTLTSKLSVFGSANKSSSAAAVGSTRANLSATANYCTSSFAAITAQVKSIYYYGKLTMVAMQSDYGMIALSNEFSIEVLN